MEQSFKRLRIYLPNLLANLLIVITALGVSVFQDIRAILAILAAGLFISFLPKMKINKFTIDTYILVIISIYFFLSAYLFNNPSSLYLFKDFVYLIFFDLLIKNRMKYSKSIYYITLVISILTLILNQVYQAGIIGSYSPAFGVPRILSISVSTLALFFLFRNVGFIEKLYITFATLVTFSASSYAILFLYCLKRIPILLTLGFTILVLNFDFEGNELYQMVKAQKELSIENKINDSKVEFSEYSEYEIAEVLSVELYQNSGIIFAFFTTTFLTLYIYRASKSWIFTTFSWILISSNPTPLILILIIGNILKVTNNEN